MKGAMLEEVVREGSKAALMALLDALMEEQGGDLGAAKAALWDYYRFNFFLVKDAAYGVDWESLTPKSLKRGLGKKLLDCLAGAADFLRLLILG